MNEIDPLDISLRLRVPHLKFFDNTQGHFRNRHIQNMLYYVISKWVSCQLYTVLLNRVY